jgi:hypothetical protein
MSSSGEKVVTQQKADKSVNMTATFRHMYSSTLYKMRSSLTSNVTTAIENEILKFMSDEFHSVIEFANEGSVNSRGFLAAFGFYTSGLWYIYIYICSQYFLLILLNINLFLYSNFLYQILSIPQYYYGAMNLICAMLGLYIMIIGAIMMLLEYKHERFMTKRIGSLLRNEFIFLFRPFGRPLLYISLGTFVVRLGSFNSLAEFSHFIAGGIAVFFGVLILHSTWKGSEELQKLKGMDMNKAKTAFNMVDKSGNGKLDCKEFVQCCKVPLFASLLLLFISYTFVKLLGFDFTHADLENALLELDANHDNEISWKEFAAWFDTIQTVHGNYGNVVSETVNLNAEQATTI